MADPVKTARITLSPPKGTQAGIFNVPASFSEPVTAFSIANISIEPGIMGVTWSVFGSGQHYNIQFVVPENASGDFEIVISGQVSISGESVDISGGLRVPITYDTASELTATFGELVYKTDGEVGEIDLQIVFSEPVLYFHKTDADLKPVIGDLPYDFEVFLTEIDASTYLFTFIPPPNKHGAFIIDLTGYVFRTTTSIRDNILITPKLVPFNSYIEE